MNGNRFFSLLNEIYSKVKLFTGEGNLKFETDCSPTNGYYMIPVYNKGEYSIRLFAPDGWFFGRFFFKTHYNISSYHNSKY